MRLLLRAAALLALVLSPSACCSGTDGGGCRPSDRYSATGGWTGSAAAGEYSQFYLMLAEGSGGSVTGTWTALVAAGGGGGPQEQTGAVSGTNASNAVTLTFQGSELRFEGTLQSSFRMEGSLSFTGSGGSFPVIFTR